MSRVSPGVMPHNMWSICRPDVPLTSQGLCDQLYKPSPNRSAAHLDREPQDNIGDGLVYGR